MVVVEKVHTPSVEDYLPVLQDIGPVGDTQGLHHVLLHDEDGRALPPHFLHHVEDIFHQYRRETEGGFVEDHHSRQ